MQKGNIGVTTENIFPIIKKFLYSDHEIFLREVISNAVDATQKLKTLASVGDFKGELGDLTVRVAVNKDAGTITISDHGVGMTEEEIDKYINQIAFSGATDFMEKYNPTARGARRSSGRATATRNSRSRMPAATSGGPTSSCISPTTARSTSRRTR